MPQPQSGVSILMPAYQLESTIGDSVDRVAALIAEWESSEVIVIDDGSTDDTRAFAEKAAAAYPYVSVIGYRPNRGKGAALKEGFQHSEGTVIVFLDADLDLPPEQLPTFLNELRRTGVDALVGAKRGAMIAGRYPLLRKLLSLAFATVNRLLFRLPVHETQTGLKAFTRSCLEATLPMLETTGYAFDLELLARIRKAGLTMTEAPVVLSPGSSRGLSLKTLWDMGLDTLKIWFHSLRW
jgi:glycosyltransferase involved in cell wall biosynthesis